MVGSRGVRAAIYVRRSLDDEHQAASLTVQTEEAKRYIESKTWTHAAEHLYVEDGASRAEFSPKKRPALIAMLNGAKSGAFDVVVLRDESRLGGDMLRTGLVIQDLIDARVRLFYYFTDEEVAPEGAVDRLVVMVRNFASELEREKISTRTRENHMVKARSGCVVGGKAYGFDNVAIMNGDRRERVEYRINDEQAAIVRRIFASYAEGASQRSIAVALNRERIPSPNAGKRGTGSWSQAQIRAMLRNTRYIGVIEWGEYRKAYRGGTRVRERQDRASMIVIERPDLRIVDDKTWKRVAERFRLSARDQGGSARTAKFRNLLSGFSICGVCSGPIAVGSARFGKDLVKLYFCKHAKERGTCENKMRRPVVEVNRAVIEAIRTQVFREAVIVEFAKRYRKHLEAQSKTASIDAVRLERDIAKIETAISNLTAALADAGRSKAITAALAEKERQLDEVKLQLGVAREAPTMVALHARRIEAEAVARIRELREALEMNTAAARRVLETILDGPMTFDPEKDGQTAQFFVSGKIKNGSLVKTSPPGSSNEGTRNFPSISFTAAA